jgi:hypothetical protein
VADREFTLEELRGEGTTAPADGSREFSFEELTGQKTPKRAAPTRKEPQSFFERFKEAAAPEIPVAEFARGAYLSPQRAGAAMAQFVPSKRETATQRAQEIEQELSESFPKRAGATVADIVGIGKLVSPVIKGATAGRRMLKAGALGGGVTAATTPVERETEDAADFAAEKIKQAAIGGAFSMAPQGIIEGVGKYIFPGSMLKATDATKKAVDEAVKKGYTLPISEITDSAALQTLDRLFDSPLVARNAPIFAERINKLMGVSGREISPEVFEKTSRGLSNEIIRLTRGKQIDLGSVTPQLRQLYADTLQATPELEPKKLQKILESLGSAGTQKAVIDGTTWHETRQLLQRNAQSLLGQPGYQQARSLVKAWDDAAFNSIPDPSWNGAFSNWKSKYTVFSDVEAAVNSNPTARSNFVKGVLDPEDLRNAIAQRRGEEFTRRMYRAPGGARGGREQTTEAGVAGSLNVFGRQPESVAPYYRAATAPKVFGTLVGAKALQDYLYSPAGQQALLYGLQPSQLRGLTSAMQPFATDLGRFAAREASGD